MKIVTITLNPSLDKTILIPELIVGELNRIDNTLEHAAGKGINISKNFATWGLNSIALGFIGGYVGNHMKDLLKHDQVETDFVEIKGNTRTNIKVKTTDGKLTEINEPGPDICNEDVEKLFDKISKHVNSDCIVVISGSAPPSLTPEIYRNIVSFTKELGAYVILDADKQALREGLKGIPNMIKPNEKEVQWYVESKHPLNEIKLIEQATAWLNQGIEQIVISQGSQGALFVDKDHIYKADALKVDVASPIGAGDAMVSALIYAKLKGWSFSESCKFAVGASSATVETSGTQPALLEDIVKKVEEVKLKEVKI